ncbi:hypothetical protein CRV24_005324 [Beauveria bassiana]|nr:hypothetical protein CRV24_005324 [Beauveria bassiana]
MSHAPPRHHPQCSHNRTTRIRTIALFVNTVILPQSLSWCGPSFDPLLTSDAFLSARYELDGRHRWLERQIRETRLFAAAALCPATHALIVVQHAREITIQWKIARITHFKKRPAGAECVVSVT